MSLIPKTAVYCLYTPLDNTYKNEIYFGSANDQFNYFSSKVRHTFEDYNYIRMDNSIKVDKPLDEMLNVNYVMFNNEEVDKWIYSFITKMEYINDGVTKLYLETDVFQTWLFDTQLMESFVVREHVVDDTIGNNLVEENLDTGEYKRAFATSVSALEDISVVASIGADQDLTAYKGATYGGVYSGLTYIDCPSDSSGVGALNDVLEGLINTGKGERIVNIFMCPSCMVTKEYEEAKKYIIHPTSFPSDIDGYTPKNNKLWCYPFCFLYISNNNGGNAILRYEFMGSSAFPEFLLTGDYSPSPTVFLIPMNYKGLEYNWEEKLTLSNYPMCNWNNNGYMTWLSQNRNKSFTGLAMGIGTTAVGVATENAGMILGGISAIGSLMAQYADREKVPDQVRGNIVGGGSTLAVGLQNFTFMPTMITRNYAERIDKFFDMFGYKVNIVKVPNINTRPYWNYVKTIDVNIKGDIPVNDMQKLKSIYNNGVTIWSNGDNIGNYSLNNH